MKKTFFLFCIALVGCLNMYSFEITKSKPEELANGITVITYTLKEDKPYVELDYSIAWPESGPLKLLKECRSAVIDLFKESDYSIQETSVNFESPDFSLEKFIGKVAREKINTAYESYKDWSDYWCNFTEKIEILADSKKTIISMNGGETEAMQNSLGFFSNKIIILNDGRKLTYSLFPSISKVRPLLLKYLTNWDEPAIKSDYSELDYPPELPFISKDYIEFQWPVSRFENLNAKVPMAEFKKFAGPSLLELIE